MKLQIVRITVSLMTIIQFTFSNPLVTENAVDSTSYICENSPVAIVQSSNNLGFSIAKIITNNSNTFFSPLGLSMAFGMAYLGAERNTAAQMEDAIGYRSSNISGNQVHSGIKQLCEDIRNRASSFEYDLTVANALFYNNLTLINNNFITDIEHHYHADALAADFEQQSAESTALINDWVKRKTLNKIDKLYDEPLSSQTQAILTNAIYFKGTWKIEFPKTRTFAGHFFDKNNPSNGKIVRMMSLADETFPYLKDEITGYKYLELPYKGEKMSMLFALPLRYDEDPDLEMNSDLYCRIRNQLMETELENIVIPRFKFTYEKNLKETMMSLGMTDAFTPGAADFGAISSESNFYISDVLHKAVIEVNEKGSEAAAVSGIQIMPVSFREVTEFVANHPFQFYIIDKISGAVIFSGTVIDPSAS